MVPPGFLVLIIKTQTHTHARTHSLHHSAFYNLALSPPSCSLHPRAEMATVCVCTCVRALGDQTRGNGPKSDCNETPQINFQSHLQLQAEREGDGGAQG